MKQKQLTIKHIPAILWGEPSDRLILSVHGNMSHKADTVIDLLARHATEKGYQVLSFDLPEHGDRKGEPILCKVQTCVEELCTVMEYAKTKATHISLFGCSMGAYFSLLAYQDETLDQAIFLSPVVDMERIIQNMMTWFSISVERLQAEQEIATPIGQPLYWDYYCYVKEHPISNWPFPTDILYGSADNLCERSIIEGFAQRFGCRLTIMQQGEHFFHTLEQLSFYKAWLEKALQ
jgi:hypothetical protein